MLVDLDAIDEFRSLSLAAINTFREAHRVLADLLEQKTDDLTPKQAEILQNVINRLRGRLNHFESSI